MFKRIKNLLDISKYTVEELRNTQHVYTDNGYSESIPSTFRPAMIVDLKGTNPFDEYETTEQSSNDTTPRNG
jgi:hypothetical protein